MESEPTKPKDREEALKRQIAALQAQLAAERQANATEPDAPAPHEREAPSHHASDAGTSTGAAIRTQGGSVVQGSVEVGGHFIGRDFIKVVTEVVHRDEDPEEAQSVIAHYLYALANDLAGLNLGEIDVAAQDASREPLQLADVYVALDTNGTTLRKIH